MHHLLQDVNAHACQTMPTTAQRYPRTDTAREALSNGGNFCQTHFDASYGVQWVWLQEHCPVKFTPQLLTELRAIQDSFATRISNEVKAHDPHRLCYQVFASKIPGIFSLGGDLALFRKFILAGDAPNLRLYAREAVDLVYLNAVNYEQPITTISLVQGQALGGGFEAALAANVIVAERQCKLGFPEIMFNMFPGMGAFQLLTRRLSAREAEKMILGGKTYSAEELYHLGLIDILANEDEGEAAVWQYIRHHSRHARGMGGFRNARQCAQPLDRLELYRMVDIWVETALTLSDSDLSVIDYLLQAQQRKQTNDAQVQAALAHHA